MSKLKSKDWGRWAVAMPSGKKAVAPPSGSAPVGSMPADFLTDNDITGGNSGSPVLNAEGKVIGLAFDGNKASLASELYAVPDYNKCASMDSLYLLWTLDKDAEIIRIIEEIGL